jgi:hypothetical protein
LRPRERHLLHSPIGPSDRRKSPVSAVRIERRFPNPLFQSDHSRQLTFRPSSHELGTLLRIILASSEASKDTRGPKFIGTVLPNPEISLTELDLGLTVANVIETCADWVGGMPGFVQSSGSSCHIEPYSCMFDKAALRDPISTFT